MTFSIVACDLRSGSWGVAVASKYLAVGSMVPAAASDAGALATQAWTNAAYRGAGLAALREGLNAEKAIARLVEADADRDRRQVSIVDTDGTAAAWTGPGCSAYAAARTGDGYAVQGNLLPGPEVLDAMADVWRHTDPTAPLASRLLDALAAGDAAGGDLRGRQSAALLVVRRDADYCTGTDMETDLRVDDAERPIEGLARLLELRYRR